jgi:CheY-like chemotaxis protein
VSGGVGAPPTAAAVLAVAGGGDPSSRVPRALLIDDDVAEIAAVRRVLARAGLDVALATNATDALAELEGAPPDVVLLAPSCENGEGAAVAATIAQADRLCAVPVIALGEDEPGIPAARWLSRPIDAAALEEAVRGALAGANATGPLSPTLSPLRGAREMGGTATLTLTPTATATTAANATLSSAAELSASWFEPDLAQGEPAAAIAPDANSALAGAAELRALLQAEAERTAREEAARERARTRARERVVGTPPPLADVLTGAERPWRAAPPPPAAAGELDARPLPSAGALSEASLPRLLAGLARAKATGRLDLDGGARSLWIEDGRVVGAASASSDERAEELALRLGLLTREQHRAVAPAAAGLASRRVGVLLLERGYLRGSELVLLARRRTEEILFAAAGAGGASRFTPGAEVAADERVAMERGTLALAVDAVRRRWHGALVDGVLGGGATLLEAAPAPPPLAELGLAPGEARLAALADGLRTVDEIVADSALDGLSARQALAALVEVGALTAKVRAAPSQAGPSRVDLARVEEKLSHVQRSDYFVILGVPRDATPNAIRAAAERLLAELAPERFGPECPEGVAGKLAEIRAVIGDARDVLADDELRGEYLAGLRR